MSTLLSSSEAVPLDSCRSESFLAPEPSRVVSSCLKSVERQIHLLLHSSTGHMGVSSGRESQPMRLRTLLQVAFTGERFLRHCGSASDQLQQGLAGGQRAIVKEGAVGRWM